ncbi:MAG: DNA topoisomerase IV subunit B [Candidatus Ureaplasma intestinipullorum]|uniref:DNA topoisomerase (ATP-hydrolyzing) n=1 Tax=Candidatus Ureaplasma intestinipullorum TaxID=2838770 RepID=A0A9E2KVY7_9BACT|nr:DNA topoisomerase IV subunit B [Candidatus Ureaplasma intestinipullorum]
MENKYSAENIKVLQGLEAVRKRPGMYIGSTDVRGLHHLIWEIVDNSIDEVMAGFANEIIVTLSKNNYVSVQDNGRGIPIDINKTTGLSGVETVLTVLHAGGKFDDSVYKTAGGLHGVGSSVVNALSDSLVCEVYRDHTIYRAKFAHGGEIIEHLTSIGNTNKKGTFIKFHADPAIFGNLQFNSSLIRERLLESAFLFNGLKIIFIDEINNTKDIFEAKNNLVDFVEYINHSKRCLSPVISYNGSNNNISISIAFQYTDNLNEIIVSFANSVKTIEGGSHENGFKSGLSSAINSYARKWKLLKDKDKNLDGDDIREGITAVISVCVPENLITYEGQTKNKLFTPEALDVVKKISEEQISYWLDSHKNESFLIIKQIIANRDAKLAAKKTRETIKKTKGRTAEKILSSKLTPAQSKEAKLNELFLVEGDSAGGSAKLGRNKKYQAILPLKGKVINVEKAKLSDVLKNEEIGTIITCLGTGIGKEFDISKLKYNKIIIMTDADVDGSHIQALLLTMFYRFMRPLVENGHVYLAIPPLYKISKKSDSSKFKYAWNEEQLEEYRQEFKSYEIQRYKGLGEMNADQLWETTMNPDNRMLLRIDIEDIIAADIQVDTLMGEDVSIRKKWIDENINFEYDE